MPSETYMADIKLNPFDAIRTSSTAYVLLPLFNNTNGEIKYYAVMVAEINYNNMSYGRFDLRSGNWPSTQTWQQAMSQTPITRYQATEIRWYPDEGRTKKIWATPINAYPNTCDIPRLLFVLQLT